MSIKQNSNELNKTALSFLDSHKFRKAQNCLIENVRMNPDCKTFHNLGIYLCDVGIKFPFVERTKTFQSIGRHLLNKSNQDISKLFLGQYYYSNDNYEKALDYFSHCVRDFFYSLMGEFCCLYSMKRFEEALDRIEKAEDFLTDDENLFEVKYNHLLALISVKKFTSAKQELVMMIGMHASVSPELLVIALLCGEEDFVMKHLEKVMRLWQIHEDFLPIFQAFLNSKGTVNLLKSSLEKFEEMQDDFYPTLITPSDYYFEEL